MPVMQEMLQDKQSLIHQSELQLSQVASQLQWTQQQHQQCMQQQQLKHKAQVRHAVHCRAKLCCL